MPKYNKKMRSNSINYFSNTSEALDIYDWKPVKKNTPKILKNVIRYKYEIDKNLGFSFLTYFIIFVIFVGGIFLLVLNANMSLKALEIDSLYDKHKKIQEENEILKNEIFNSYDLVEIEKIAKLRLGMSRPKAHQIIRINVPIKDYTQYYTIKNSEDISYDKR